MNDYTRSPLEDSHLFGPSPRRAEPEEEPAGLPEVRAAAGGGSALREDIYIYIYIIF